MYTRLASLLVICLPVALLTGCPPADDDDSAPPVDDDDTVIDYGDPPTATVDLLPDAPGAEDILVASIHAEDPEGGEVFLQVRWEMDGAAVDAYDDLLFVPTSATEVGEEWTVTVIPSDGGQDGAAATDAAVIGNGLPVLFAVTIAPQAPAEGDLLVATPGGTLDPDGDTVSVSYSWWVGGSESAVTGDTLSSADFGKGDTIWVVATPNDGLNDGAAVISNVVEAVNTEPSGVGATVDPASGTEETTFTCTGEGFDDIDGDTEGWLYTWEINGIFQVDGPTLDGGWFDRGDWVVCQAWPHDGEAPGEMVEAAPILVDNIPPVASGVAITPDPATSSDVLTVDITALTDIDGDQVVPLYAWDVDGQPAGEEAALEPDAVARGAQVTVTVTPFDGTDEGAPVTSASVTIGNSAPEFSGVELVYDATLDSYVASGLGWSDPDDDPEGYAYAWANAAGPLAETTGVLAAGLLSSPDTVTVTLTATDGVDDGNAITSDTLDHAPAAEVTPAIAHFGSVDIGCAVDGIVTVDNAGTTNLVISDLTLTETLGSGYLELATTWSFPVQVVPGESLDIAIVYDAFEASESAADLVLTTNAAQPTITVPVMGLAEPADPVTERFFPFEDNQTWAFQLPVLEPPTEILVDGDVETDFVFDPDTNTLNVEDIDPSDGDETIMTYVPVGTVCPDNLAPVVVASLTTTTPGACEPTLVDTADSYDPEGDAFWLDHDFASVPATSLLTGDDVSDDGLTASVLADVDGDYELDIWGVDELGAAGAETTVTFSGLAGLGGGASDPVADAGPDIVATAVADCWMDNYGGLDCMPCVGEPLRLDGSGSTDADGGGLTWEWTTTSPHMELMSHTRSSRPFVHTNPDGDEIAFSPAYLTATFELTVTDCDGAQSTDTVDVELVCTANVLGTATIHQ